MGGITTRAKTYDWLCGFGSCLCCPITVTSRTPPEATPIAVSCHISDGWGPESGTSPGALLLDIDNISPVRLKLTTDAGRTRHMHVFHELQMQFVAWLCEDASNDMRATPSDVENTRRSRG
jgi:hypothetical protein